MIRPAAPSWPIFIIHTTILIWLVLEPYSIKALFLSAATLYCEGRLASDARQNITFNGPIFHSRNHHIRSSISGGPPANSCSNRVCQSDCCLAHPARLGASAFAQTKLKLSAVKPGTEQVQLIQNGDFQFQGSLVGTNYPNPTGWSRGNEMYATAGSNMVAVNSGVVAKGQVNTGATVGSYTRVVTLEPATAYVFSAYMWNMGDAVNHVNAVIDMTDVPGEPQIVVSFGDSEADKGYFVYRSFNTSTTGTNLTVRAFYDGFAGTGTAAGYFPVAAQWDNIAITKSNNFVAPQTSNSTATIRPLVSITTPLDGTIAYVNSKNGLTITATTSDLDGTVTNVQFFAGTNTIGNRTSPPWNVTWLTATSGTYVLTAVASDNAGATTLSAPVNISLTVSPVPPALRIAAVTPNVSLLWPTGDVTTVAQAASNIISPTWQKVTNAIVITNHTNTLPAGNAPQNFSASFPKLDPKHHASQAPHGLSWWFVPGRWLAVNSWVHWFRNNNPVATNVTWISGRT
jgi:hypothetical protein